MKKAIAIFMTVTIILSAVALVLPVSAEESGTAEKFPPTEGWKEINEASDWDDIYSGGKYYLSCDIEFEGVQYYPADDTKNVTIDGNGHTVKLTDGQPSLFKSVEGLTMSNIILEGSLVHEDKECLNSPIALWSTKGATVLTNVISRVNYEVATTEYDSQSASGIAVIAQRGSVFTDVIYEGTVTVKPGAKLLGVGGMAYYAEGAVFDGCINRGRIVIEGGPTIGVTGEDMFYIGGIVGKVGADVELKNCTNAASITVSEHPYQLSEEPKTGFYTIGGIAGFSETNVNIDSCINSGDITVAEDVNASVSGYVGGIFGYGERKANIEYCKNKGKITINEDEYRAGGILAQVTTAILEGCVNSGAITANNKNISIGGMMGRTTGTYTEFLRCTNEGDITLVGCSASNAAGMLAWAYHFNNLTAVIEITSCVNTGKITADEKTTGAFVGGMLGRVAGTPNMYVTSCLNSGDISNNPKLNGWTPAGGIVGGPLTFGLPWDGQHSADHRITKCVNTGKIIGGDQVGGIMGATIQYLTSGAQVVISSCVNKGEIVGTISAGGILGALNDGDKNSWDSDVGITIHGCENSGRVISGKRSGGIIGRVYDQLKKTPTVTVSSCINTGEIGNGEEVCGGLVGYSVFKVDISDCISLGKVNGAAAHPFTTAEFAAKDSLYDAELWSGTVDGASAATAENVAAKKATMDIMVYDISPLMTEFERLGALRSREYTPESWKAFWKVYMQTQNNIAFYETEVLQSEVIPMRDSLLAAEKGLVLRSSVPVETPPEAEEPAPDNTERATEAVTEAPTEKATENTPAGDLADWVLERASAPAVMATTVIIVLIVAVAAGAGIGLWFWKKDE